MTSEFVDTNILVYAHDRNARDKQSGSAELLRRLTVDSTGALSIQVLVEFYTAATKKLAISSQVAQEVIADFGVWTIHRPGHADVIRAAALHRRYKFSWWDALIVNSALELGCAILWSEDLAHGQRFGSMTVRNPFL